MKKHLLLFATLALPAHAALVWTGNVSADLYDETNWIDSTTSLAPPAGTIDPNVVTSSSFGGIVIDSANFTGAALAPINGSGTGGSTFRLGDNPLTLTNTSLGRAGGFGTDASETGTGTITVVNSSYDLQFFAQADVTVSGNSTITLNGGGGPLAASTIDLLDTLAVLQFNSETIESFLFFASPTGQQSEHFGKITYNGAALVFGTDPFVVEPGDNVLATEFNGGNGVQLQAVPEPGIALLGGIGVLALLRRRRD